MRLTRWGAVPPDPCRDLDDGSPAFTQWWYFDADFVDGHRLMAILQPRTFARVEGEGNDASPGITLALTDPERRNHRRRGFFPGTLAYEPSAGVVRFGENRMEVRGGEYRLAVAIDDIGCDLRWVPELPPWAPLPGLAGRMSPPLLWLGQMRFAPGKSFEYASMIPRGRVEGTLRLGGRELAVRGAGYHERGVSQIPFGRLFAHWYWARLYVGEWTFVFPVAQTPSRSFRAPMRAMLVARGREILCDLFDVTGLLLHHRVRRAEKHPVSGRLVPRQVAYKVRLPGLRLDLELELFHERESFVFSPFDGPTEATPAWMQHFAHARVALRWRGEDIALEGEAVFESMFSGAV